MVRRWNPKDIILRKAVIGIISSTLFALNVIYEILNNK
jgi:hypothetical protein